MFTALRAASLTLKTVLERSMRADPDLALVFDPVMVGSAVVSLSTPDEMPKAGEAGLSVWLYRLVRDEQTLNRPPTRPAPGRIRRQPLPVRLHYLLTPIVTADAGMPAPETEQLILGRVLQTLHDKPLLHGADLGGSFEGTTVDLAVRLETLSLEEITRIWDSLERSYQLSLSYEVSVVEIDSLRETELGPPVTIVLPEFGLAEPEAVS
jgi:hypothetical protein